MEIWVKFSGKEGHPKHSNPRPGRELNCGPQDWEAEILSTAPTPSTIIIIIIIIIINIIIIWACPK